MLSVHKTPYVGRFARDWHRLSTTEPLAVPIDILERGKFMENVRQGAPGTLGHQGSAPQTSDGPASGHGDSEYAPQLELR